MNTEALRQMIRVLEAVKANELKFDLSEWISENEAVEVVRKVGSAETFIDAAKAHYECGTSACACGFAASDEWFIKQGFRWIKEPAYEDTAEHLYLGYHDPKVVTDADASFEHIGWSALRKFFDMPDGDMAEIFDVSGYVNEDLFEDDDDGAAFRAECAKITPQDVINKIRTYLK